MKMIKILISVFLMFISTDSFSQSVWVSKSNLNLSGTAGAFSFSIGDKGYIGTGTNLTEGFDDLWEYDQNLNVWTQKVNFPDVRRYGVALSIGDYAYVGTGLNSEGPIDDFWQYDPMLNEWSKKAKFPGGKRYWAAGFSIGDKGYVGTGYNNGSKFKNDFWEYDPASDTWTQKTDVGGGGKVTCGRFFDR
jgi:hypothetical protein